MELDAFDGALSQPFWSLLPWRLAIIGQCRTVSTICLVANAGDVFDVHACSYASKAGGVSTSEFRHVERKPRTLADFARSMGRSHEVGVRDFLIGGDAQCLMQCAILGRMDRPLNPFLHVFSVYGEN